MTAESPASAVLESTDGDIEWVWVANTNLGGVSPGERERPFMRGVIATYRPSRVIGQGTRWCSTAWTERRVGRRGFRKQDQAGMSMVLTPTKGNCMFGDVVVPPQDRFEEACEVVAGVLLTDLDVRVGLSVWSPAIVRFPGRSLYGIHLESSGPIDPAARLAWTRLSDRDLWMEIGDEVGAELLVSFTGGRDELGQKGICSSWKPACPAEPADEVEGDTYLGEIEPVPRCFVDIAQRLGNGLLDEGNEGVAVEVPTGSWRPLEPDDGPELLVETAVR